METPLPLCLLSIFIVTGASLECEQCIGIGNTCSGPMETCSPGLDRCAVVLSETTVGTKVNAIVKHCVPSRSCNEGLSIINMGQAGKILSQVFCCVGTECKMMRPTLTPLKSNPNGKVCPACYALNSECEKKEMAECHGEENFCLDISGTTDTGTLAVETTVKGCTNSATCQELKEHSASFSGITISSSSSCKPASSSGGHRIIPGSFGLFLAALAGLLFVMPFP